MTDFLTGLANRRSFSRACDDLAGIPLGFILFDLDDFRLVNSRFGHDGGDRALKAVGSLLREGMPAEVDSVARLGGEEFAVLCPGVNDEAQLVELAERLRLKIQGESIGSESEAIRLTASFGVALCAGSDTDWRAIYAKADEALYISKAQGKNRVSKASTLASSN